MPDIQRQTLRLLSLAASIAAAFVLALPSGCSEGIDRGGGGGGGSTPEPSATGGGGGAGQSSAGTNVGAGNGGGGEQGGTGGATGMGGGGGNATSSTGMGGGGGNATSSTGMGGGGGNATSSTGVGGGFIACATDDECPPDEACKTYECTSAGVCVLTYGFFGKAVNLDPADCRYAVCGASGAFQEVSDDSEVPPDDGNECTAGTCQNGAAVHAPKNEGKPCAQGLCAAGQCASSPCQTPADCPASPLCFEATCSNQTCKYNPSPAGTQAADLSPFDCIREVCDGNGAAVESADPDDTPSDGNDCTMDTCSGTTPMHTVKPNGNPCSGGTFCYEGVCSQCGVDSNCPAPATCKVANGCISGVCSYGNVPNGTSCGFLKSCNNGQCN